MKNCPNCNEEIIEDFQICWNCNYSFNEKQVIEFEEQTRGSRNINCIRCNTKLLFSGNYKFHEGASIGFLGNLFEAFVNRESFDIYTCPKCGKVEFYIPQSY